MGIDFDDSVFFLDYQISLEVKKAIEYLLKIIYAYVLLKCIHKEKCSFSFFFTSPSYFPSTLPHLFFFTLTSPLCPFFTLVHTPSSFLPYFLSPTFVLPPSRLHFSFLRFLHCSFLSSLSLTFFLHSSSVIVILARNHRYGAPSEDRTPYKVVMINQNRLAH